MIHAYTRGADASPYADEIRRQVEAAPRNALPAIAAALWRAFGDGHVPEVETERIAERIAERQRLPEDRRDAPAPADPALLAAVGVVRRYGSRPRTHDSLARRRRWAASGRIPGMIAARFTLAEQAVLAVVAAQTALRKDCRLAIEHMAAVAGVSRSTVKNAIREAERLGFVTVEERRLTGFRNDTNILRIVSPEWVAWLRLTRKAPADLSLGGGVKSSTGTSTRVLESGRTRAAEPGKGYRKGSRSSRRDQNGSDSREKARQRPARVEERRM